MSPDLSDYYLNTRNLTVILAVILSYNAINAVKKGVDKVLEYVYMVIMHTPLGRKQGAMLLTIHGNKIDGLLDILGNKNAVRGEIDDNGVCKLFGYIKTLVRKIEYTAIGRADESEINLTLQDERNIFHLYGTANTSLKGNIK